MNRQWTIAYLLIAILEIVTEMLDLSTLRMLSKPLLMPVLAMAFRSSLDQTDTRNARMLTAAFFFSWIGDVALMFVDYNPNFFLLGLVGFLITHGLYILIFRVPGRQFVQQILGANKWFLGLTLLYFTGLIIYIFPSIPSDFKIPVIVYSLTIAFMVLTAGGRVGALGFVWILSGALLFMFSDSIIAINKFRQPVPLAGVWIMTLYITAQYLIGEGVLQLEKR